MHVFGSVIGPECWSVCVCELAAFAWLDAVEREVRLSLDDYRGAELCSETEAQPRYSGLFVQQGCSPDVKQVDTVVAADYRQGVSKPALEDVVAGWELGWAAPVIGSVEEAELVVAVLETAAVAVAGIVQ